MIVPYPSGALHFNPRSPHGERPDPNNYKQNTEKFQPTLPARGATNEYFITYGRTWISTHAPRTGSDYTTSENDILRFHFNPRSPHGERRNREREEHATETISTHAPRTGSDSAKQQFCRPES